MRTSAVTSRVKPIEGPPISSHARAIPIRKADDHQGRDGVHCAGVVWLGDHVGSLGQLDHERDDQPEQEQRQQHPELKPGIAAE